MKVLFVIDEYIIEPLGIGYLSSCLKQAGHETELLVVPESQWENVAYWHGELRRRNVDMACFSVTTGRHQRFARVNAAIKKAQPDVFTLVGGPHCTFFPQYIEKGFDALCRGEGFDAIVEVAAAVEQRKSVDDITGITTLRKSNPIRPMRDMDSVPFPDREILYQRDKNRMNPIRSVLASGYCQMHCSYCASPMYRVLMGQGEGAKNRPMRNASKVAYEIQELSQYYPTGLIYFQDDIFPIYSPDWLEGFCAAYVDVAVPFHVQTRAEFITEGRILKLKLHGITFAIESGNPERRRKILKRYGDNEMYVFRIENVLGTPGETLKECFSTLDLNIQCTPDIGWASLFQPYPGTELGNQLMASGEFDGNLDKLGEDFFHGYEAHAMPIQRLQSLFGITVWKPWLRPLLPLLIRLPLDYHSIYRAVKQYLYSSRLYRVACVK